MKLNVMIMFLMKNRASLVFISWSMVAYSMRYGCFCKWPWRGQEEEEDGVLGAISPNSNIWIIPYFLKWFQKLISLLILIIFYWFFFSKFTNMFKIWFYQKITKIFIIWYILNFHKEFCFNCFIHFKIVISFRFFKTKYISRHYVNKHQISNINPSS